MMKTITKTIALVAGLSLCACTESLLTPAETCTSTVTVSGASKATFTDTGGVNPDEVSISTLEVFIFDGDKVDGHNRASATSIKVSSTAGDREVWALVNAPDFSSVKTRTELMAAVVKLSDNSLSNFMMVGSKSCTIAAACAVEVPVERFVSRVVVKKISNSMGTAALQSKTFKVEKIYLTNVQAENNVAHEGYQDDGGAWVNKQKYDSSLAPSLQALLYDAPAKTIDYGSSDETRYVYYPFPNDYDSEAKNGGSWSKRHTKLVIEATLDGKTYYYPVTLPKLESNKSYEFNSITITREGSEDPDIPVTVSEVTVSIDIRPWLNVDLGDTEI